MKPIAARSLSAEEAQVLRAALDTAPSHDIALGTDVSALKVVGVCECGCRSLYFLPGQLGERPVIEGCGRTPNGRSMEFMLWEANGQLAVLDIIDHESTGLLPTPESLSSWENAGR
jgi:hypothetical protein